MRKYGTFNEDKKFIITNPYTPEPWLHYLIRIGQPGTQTFCSGVTYTGGGFDVRGTHENTFIDTKLHLNDEDNMGRYIYIHDKTASKLFTTTWQPIRPEEQKLTTTLEFGKITFQSEYGGIKSVQEMFVPEEFDGWIQNVRICNTSSEKKELSLYPFVPVHMGDALVRLLAGDNDALFGGVSYDEELKALVFRRNHGTAVNDDPEKINGMLGNVAVFYCTLNDGTTQYETDMEGFFGDRFHNQKNPGSIEEGKLRCKDTAYLRRSCGVFKNDLVLEPGQEVEFAVALIAGSTADYFLNDKKQMKDHIALVNSPAGRKSSSERVLEYWKDEMGRLKLASPEPAINRGFAWLQYQCEIVYILNRMKSRYHTGYEYGWGFRDILQDVLYKLPYGAEKMKDVFKHISTQMFTSGKTYHNFFIDQPGNKNIEASDDPLWFVFAVIKFCKETGDFGFLDEITNYAEVHEGEGEASGSILEHCIKAVERVWTDRSERNLPYMKDCDWNDDLNELRIDDKPNDSMESIMVAQQLYAAFNQMAELFEASSRKEELASAYRENARVIKEAIYKYGMDKEGYFIRATSVDNKKNHLGSSENKTARIFLETQTFGINCGVTEGEQSGQILDAVEKYLDSDFGAMLCFPYFTDLSEKGILPEKSWNIEKEPPGIKENGGIFMHLNAWLVQSYCIAGRGNDGVAHYLKNLPENMSSDQDRYKSEPYVYPEYVRGKGVDQHGRGGHTWLTGTAPTMHAALTEYIYGVRADYKGLEIDPCVDKNWDEFSLERNFRGARYKIHFKNPDKVEKGVAQITVDGEKISGTVLPDFADGKDHTVEVVMG